MKINNNKPPEGLDPGSVKKTAFAGSGGKANGAGPSDNIEISRKGKEMQSLLNAVHRLPQMRMDKVAAISQSVKTGQYAVSAENIAEKMISEMT
ncbi:MAG: flagellar biosynthesis anti-sigma factor FlgM [Nitrospiraceae bacterium]|nr:flagellar biosynthesis anti-sigma factor FlgM [Nitrospiraceae bacterium]